MERHEREKEHADFVKKLKYVNNLILYALYTPFAWYLQRKNIIIIIIN